jgi:hypothetical protein
MALTTGCYTYAPIELATVTPGMDVRARVRATTAEQLGPSLGMSDARLLSGSVVDLTPDGVTLRVESVRAGTIGAPEGLLQQILISRADVLELESKRLDQGRTRLAVAAGVVGAAALAVTIVRGRSTGESAVTEPPANFTLRGSHLGVGGLPLVLGFGWRGGPRSTPRGSPR